MSYRLRFVLVGILFVGLFLATGVAACHDDQTVIDRHEQMLDEEGD